VTVLESIQRSADFLTRKGVESPRLQAELLLAHLLRLPRMQLYLRFEQLLDTAQVDALRELMRRRGQREPLQHIVGGTSFCGLDLIVGPQVLIPRPETEMLAEQAWQWLSAHPSGSSSALDFGTGSGCIAIAIAAKCPTAAVTALDVSPEALAVARANAARHGLESRIRFLEGNGFAAVPGDDRFDLIISNPPYIPTGEIEGLEPEVRDHDPRLALDGGADGLDFYHRLAAEAPERLKPGGKLMAELGDGQSEAVRAIFSDQKWVVENIREDYSRRPRILTAIPAG
jgi:release factor glutamine methyltransferase